MVEDKTANFIEGLIFPLIFQSGSGESPNF
jgi:hypothetical protein